jgi:hypothetical protein
MGSSFPALTVHYQRTAYQLARTPLMLMRHFRIKPCRADTVVDDHLQRPQKLEISKKVESCSYRRKHNCLRVSFRHSISVNGAIGLGGNESLLCCLVSATYCGSYVKNFLVQCFEEVTDASSFVDLKVAARTDSTVAEHEDYILLLVYAPHNSKAKRMVDRMSLIRYVLMSYVSQSSTQQSKHGPQSGQQPQNGYDLYAGVQSAIIEIFPAKSLASNAHATSNSQSRHRIGYDSKRSNLLTHSSAHPPGGGLSSSSESPQNPTVPEEAVGMHVTSSPTSASPQTRSIARVRPDVSVLNGGHKQPVAVHSSLLLSRKLLMPSFMMSRWSKYTLNVLCPARVASDDSNGHSLPCHQVSPGANPRLLTVNVQAAWHFIDPLDTCTDRSGGSNAPGISQQQKIPSQLMSINELLNYAGCYMHFLFPFQLSVPPTGSSTHNSHHHGAAAKSSTGSGAGANLMQSIVEFNTTLRCPWCHFTPLYTSAHYLKSHVSKQSVAAATILKQAISSLILHLQCFHHHCSYEAIIDHLHCLHVVIHLLDDPFNPKDGGGPDGPDSSVVHKSRVHKGTAHGAKHLRMHQHGANAAQVSNSFNRLKPFVFIRPRGTVGRGNKYLLNIPVPYLYPSFLSVSPKCNSDDEDGSIVGKKRAKNYHNNLEGFTNCDPCDSTDMVATRQYYNPRTGQPLQFEELGTDSEDGYVYVSNTDGTAKSVIIMQPHMKPYSFGFKDGDKRTLLYDPNSKAARLLDEFSDVSFEEKTFMKMWNKHVSDMYPYMSDSFMLLLFESFVVQNAAVIVHLKLRHNLLLHLLTAYEFGLLRSDEILKCLAVVDRHKSVQRDMVL